MKTVLEADSVSKDFREGRGDVVSVLRGVSLSLARGEIVSLEGPSGSGKTTLLSILGCILTASSGRVVVDGEEISGDRPARLPEIRRKSIGFVFQQFNLFPSLTALENVEYALNVKGEKGAAALREAERVIDAVGHRPRARGEVADPPGRRADGEPGLADRRPGARDVPGAREERGPGAFDRHARPEGPHGCGPGPPHPGRPAGGRRDRGLIEEVEMLKGSKVEALSTFRQFDR